MSRWRLEFSESFEKAIKRLDKPTLRRLKGYFDEIAELEDPSSRGKALVGNRTGYWRYRFADYRIIVKIERNRLTIIAIDFGHRSEIYRR